MLTQAYRFHRQAGRASALALRLAREDVAAGTRRYPSAPRVMGSGPRAEPGRTWFTDSDAGLRSVRDVSGRCGGYRATDWTGPLLPHVARVGTARADGSGFWIAGYLETDFGGFVWDATLYAGEPDTIPDDARRAADDMARRAAEKESEYHDGWQRGRSAADAIEDARRDLAAALATARAERARMREAVAAARAACRGAVAGVIGPHVWREMAALARAAKDARRDTIDEARAVWSAAWDAARESCPVWLKPSHIRAAAAEYDSDPWRAGWCQGFER